MATNLDFTFYIIITLPYFAELTCHIRRNDRFARQHQKIAKGKNGVKYIYRNNLTMLKWKSGLFSTSRNTNRRILKKIS